MIVTKKSCVAPHILHLARSSVVLLLRSGSCAVIVKEVLGQSDSFCRIADFTLLQVMSAHNAQVQITGHGLVIPRMHRENVSLHNAGQPVAEVPKQIEDD